MWDPWVGGNCPSGGHTKAGWGPRTLLSLFPSHQLQTTEYCSFQPPWSTLSSHLTSEVYSPVKPGMGNSSPNAAALRITREKLCYKPCANREQCSRNKLPPNRKQVKSFLGQKLGMLMQIPPFVTRLERSGMIGPTQMCCRERSCTQKRLCSSCSWEKATPEEAATQSQMVCVCRGWHSSRERVAERTPEVPVTLQETAR